MLPSKPVHRILAAIALAALAAIALVWTLAHTGIGRNWVAGRLAAATGLPVTVGDLSVGFVPRLALSVGTVTVSQPEGFGPAPLAEIGQARIVLPWSSLFGRTAVQSVAIEDAVVRL